jgi:hypothetical protein
LTAISNLPFRYSSPPPHCSFDIALKSNRRSSNARDMLSSATYESAGTKRRPKA